MSRMVFGSFCIWKVQDGVLHRLGMCSVAPKIVFVFVDSKGDVKEFFWLAVWAVFGSCPDGVWVFLHLQVSTWCLHRLGMCSVAPKIVLCGCGLCGCFRLF